MFICIRHISWKGSRCIQNTSLDDDLTAKDFVTPKRVLTYSAAFLFSQRKLKLDLSEVPWIVFSEMYELVSGWGGLFFSFILPDRFSISLKQFVVVLFSTRPSFSAITAANFSNLNEAEQGTLIDAQIRLYASQHVLQLFNNCVHRKCSGIMWCV